MAENQEPVEWLQVVLQILENNRIIRERLTVSDEPDSASNREQRRDLVEKLKSQLEIEDHLIRKLIEDRFEIADLAESIAANIKKTE